MPKLMTSLWFDGQAEEAARLYTSLFKDGRIGRVTHYTKEGFEIHGQPEGQVLTVEFEFGGQRYIGLNGGPQFKFNESMSIVVLCDTQDEIDHYWSRLTADGGEESMCGWLKDKFGLSWQITPAVLQEMLHNPDKRKVERVTKAFLQMRKFNIKALEDAFNG